MCDPDELLAGRHLLMEQSDSTQFNCHSCLGALLSPGRLVKTLQSTLRHLCQFRSLTFAAKWLAAFLKLNIDIRFTLCSANPV